VSTINDGSSLQAWMTFASDAMSQRRTPLFLAVTLLLGVGGFESAAQRPSAAVRRIDHIMLRADTTLPGSTRSSPRF
jgi:hypothetical protein